MIRYALKCREGHAFESWFQSATAFDALVKAGHVTCMVCGGPDVSKALMAPGVGAAAAQETQHPVSNPQDLAIARMRKHVEENATYVGGKFAEKARAIHDGTSTETSIYGEASAAEARALIADGVPVLPLPFRPKQKLQ